MSGLLHSLRIVGEYTRHSIAISLQHRIGAILFVIGKLIRFGLFGVFVAVLLTQTEVLAGYTINQTLIFFVTYHLIDGLAQLLYRQVYRFRPLVLTGDLDLILVKPMHPFLRILVGGIDILDMIPIGIYMVLIGVLIQQSGGVSIAGILSYLVLVLNGLLISTGFHILVLALGIISTEVDHTIMIYRDITRMGSFPVDIYAQPVRWIVTFVIPIGIMITFPVQALFGMLSPVMMVISVGFALAFLTGSILAWQFALARYQSASS